MGCCNSSTDDPNVNPDQVPNASDLSIQVGSTGASGASATQTKTAGTTGGSTDTNGASSNIEGGGSATSEPQSDETPAPAEIRPLDGQRKQSHSHRAVPRRSQSAKDGPPDMSWRQKSVSVPGIVGETLPETTFQAMKSIIRDQVAPELVSPVTTPFMPESIPTLDELLPTIPNGSLILLSGNDPTCSIIKMAISKGHFTHVAMFVREEGESLDSKTEPLIFSGDRTSGLKDCFIKQTESLSDDHESKTTTIPGVSLSLLKEYIANFDVFFGKGIEIDPKHSSVAAIVRLKGLPDGEFDEGRFWKEMRRLGDSGYPSSVKAFDDWESDDASFREAGVSAAFSTQLVAHMYEHLGFMADRYPPNEFVPSSFDTTADGQGDAQNCLLPMLTLEPPQFFRLTEEDMRKYRIKTDDQSASMIPSPASASTEEEVVSSSSQPVLFPDTIAAAAGGVSPVQVTTDDARHLIEQSKQCELFFDKPVPKWWNDGRRNHDWHLLRKLLQVTYYTTGEMTSGDKGTDLEIINWPRDHGIKLESSDIRYCLWKIVDDESYILTVCSHAVSEVKENFEELTDYLHELMDEARETAEEIVLDIQVLITDKVKRSETPVVGHSEGGTLALCVAQRLNSNGIGLCPAGAGFMPDVFNDNLLAVRIKNDPISQFFKPDCAVKELDLGFTKEQGMLLEAHMPDFETLEIHA